MSDFDVRISSDSLNVRTEQKTDITDIRCVVSDSLETRLVTIRDGSESYTVTIEDDGNKLDVKAESVLVGNEPPPTYNGDYVVIPQAWDETTLPCRGYLMDNNVKVRKVPYYETSNTTGTTIFIASEVN